MPIGRFENFDACVLAMKAQGHDEESARRICGALERDSRAREEGARAAMADVMKKVGGESFPAGDFLIVEDAKSPDSWHLQVKRHGKPDHGLMGAAYAALHQGYRGNRYEGPDKQKAIDKLKTLYTSEKIDWPGSGQAEYRATFPSRVVAAADPEGRVWEIEIARAGVAASRRFEMPAEVLERDGAVFDGAPSYRDHQSFEEMRSGKGRSIEHLIGWVRQPRMGAGVLQAMLHLLEPEKWAAKLRAIQQAPAGVGGMSFDIAYQAEPKRGLPLGRITRIVKANSVDLVTRPDMSGRILRAVAAHPGEFEEFHPPVQPGDRPPEEPTSGATRQVQSGGVMKEQIERILQAMARFDSAKVEALRAEFKDLEEDKQLERAIAAFEELKAPEPPKEPAAPAQGGEVRLNAADRQLLEEVKAQRAETQKQIDATKILQCGVRLKELLSDSKLPTALQAEIERRYKGKAFEEGELMEDIKSIRQTFASMSPSQHVVDPGVRITLEPQDKLQIGLDKLLGLTHQVNIEADARGIQRVVAGEALESSIPPFRSLKSAYVEYTGDPDITGETRVPRLTAIFNTAGFPYALASTLNRLLLREYGEVNYRWQDIVTSITSASDFRNQERVRVGYFGDLSTVAESGPYTEIAAPTDERIQFAVGKRGNKLTVTRETIINDDIGMVQRKVRNLGRSAARTLAAFVWAFAIDNATYDADSLAWFVAGHSNLGSTTLSGTVTTDVATLNAAKNAIFAQTEKDSAKTLGLKGPFLLVVPIDLEDYAIYLNISRYQDSSFTPNPWFGKFGQNNERIFTNPLFSDATDWFLFDVSGNVDILELSFLQGRQMPEFFLADQPSVGQMFTNDELVWKIRHEYGGDILDYRGAYKCVNP